jgi:hypothetical protein
MVCAIRDDTREWPEEAELRSPVDQLAQLVRGL